MWCTDSSNRRTFLKQQSVSRRSSAFEGLTKVSYCLQSFTLSMQIVHPSALPARLSKGPASEDPKRPPRMKTYLRLSMLERDEKIVEIAYCWCMSCRLVRMGNNSDLLEANAPALYILIFPSECNAPCPRMTRGNTPVLATLPHSLASRGLRRIRRAHAGRALNITRPRVSNTK